MYTKREDKDNQAICQLCGYKRGEHSAMSLKCLMENGHFDHSGAIFTPNINEKEFKKLNWKFKVSCKNEAVAMLSILFSLGYQWKDYIVRDEECGRKEVLYDTRKPFYYVCNNEGMKITRGGSDSHYSTQKRDWKVLSIKTLYNLSKKPDKINKLDELIDKLDFGCQTESVKKLAKAIIEAVKEIGEKYA